jgi:hypothetical protein
MRKAQVMFALYEMCGSHGGGILRLMSSGVHHRVVWLIYNNVSEELTASFFRI